MSFPDTAGLQAGQTIFILGEASGWAISPSSSRNGRVRKSSPTTSTRNVAFVRELGADVVIDYTRQAVKDLVQEVDVVLDMMDEALLRQASRKVKRGGRVVSLLRVHKELGEQLTAKADAEFTFILVHPSGEQLTEISSLCDTAQLKVSIEAVSRCKVWLVHTG